MMPRGRSYHSLTVFLLAQLRYTYDSHIKIVVFVWEVCKFPGGTIEIDKTGTELRQKSCK